MKERPHALEPPPRHLTMNNDYVRKELGMEAMVGGDRQLTFFTVFV